DANALPTLPALELVSPQQCQELNPAVLACLTQERLQALAGPAPGFGEGGVGTRGRGLRCRLLHDLTSSSPSFVTTRSRGRDSFFLSRSGLPPSSAAISPHCRPRRRWSARWRSSSVSSWRARSSSSLPATASLGVSCAAATAARASSSPA